MPVMDGFELSSILREQRQSEAGNGAEAAERSSPRDDEYGAAEVDRDRSIVRRGKPVRRCTPLVIGLTGDASDDHIQRCLDAGMSHVLTKPIKMDELLQTLKELSVRGRDQLGLRESPGCVDRTPK